MPVEHMKPYSVSTRCINLGKLAPSEVLEPAAAAGRRRFARVRWEAAADRYRRRRASASDGDAAFRKPTRVALAQFATSSLLSPSIRSITSCPTNRALLGERFQNFGSFATDVRTFHPAALYV